MEAWVNDELKKKKYARYARAMKTEQTNEIHELRGKVQKAGRMRMPLTGAGEAGDQNVEAGSKTEGFRFQKHQTVGAAIIAAVLLILVAIVCVTGGKRTHREEKPRETVTTTESYMPSYTVN